MNSCLNLCPENKNSCVATRLMKLSIKPRLWSCDLSNYNIRWIHRLAKFLKWKLRHWGKKNGTPKIEMETFRRKQMTHSSLIPTDLAWLLKGCWLLIICFSDLLIASIHLKSGPNMSQRVNHQVLPWQKYIFYYCYCYCNFLHGKRDCMILSIYIQICKYSHNVIYYTPSFSS